MTADDQLMNQISTLGAEQIKTAEHLAKLDAQLRPLVQKAGERQPDTGEPLHYPTELSNLTRWDRTTIRLIVEPGAAPAGRKAHDPNRQPRPIGRKPTKRATADPI